MVEFCPAYRSMALIGKIAIMPVCFMKDTKIIIEVVAKMRVGKVSLSL